LTRNFLVLNHIPVFSLCFLNPSEGNRLIFFESALRFLSCCTLTLAPPCELAASSVPVPLLHPVSVSLVFPFLCQLVGNFPPMRFGFQTQVIRTVKQGPAYLASAPAVPLFSPLSRRFSFYVPRANRSGSHNSFFPVADACFIPLGNPPFPSRIFSR